MTRIVTVYHKKGIGDYQPLGFGEIIAQLSGDIREVSSFMSKHPNNKYKLIGDNDSSTLECDLGTSEENRSFLQEFLNTFPSIPYRRSPKF